MNRRTILAFCMAALCLLTGAAAAQELCKPDCPMSKWSAVAVHRVTLPGGCQVDVYYATRNACGMYWDTQIVAIDQVAPFHASCVSYAAMNTKDFLAVITEELLGANPMGFPPLPPVPPATRSCLANWRVIQGGCWMKAMHYEYEPTGEPLPLWQPCPGSSCCLKAYEVCSDPCGNREVKQLSPGTPPSSCPVNPSYPCTPVCG